MRFTLQTLFLSALPVILALLVGGCASEKVVSVPQEVKVPVTVFCKIDPVTKPSLPFDEQAATSMSLFQKSQLLLAQDQVHKAYETKLEGALAGCAAPPVPASTSIAQ